LFFSNIETENCPSDWFSHASSCYSILKKKTNWLNGHFECQQLAADYLQINDNSEKIFIGKLLNFIERQGQFYLGAEDYIRSIFKLFLIYFLLD
jgi:hypothetical protein